MRLPLRTAVFWAHLVCGVAIATVVLVMSVTGVILTYEQQMVQWADREYWTTPAAPGERAPLSALATSAEAYDPESRASSLILYSDPDAPVMATIGGGRNLYLDPSTAQVRGENNTGMRGFLAHVRGWHRWFNVSGEGRGLARAVTGWANLAFLFLILSGLYLWFPRRWAEQHLRTAFLIRAGTKGRARDFNWHQVFGFWSAIPLAVIVFTAVTISFPWARNWTLSFVPADPPTPSVSSPAPLVDDAPGAEPRPFEAAILDAVVPRLEARVDDWRRITLTIPGATGTPIRARIEQGLPGQPQKKVSVTYDASSGREVAFSTFADQDATSRARDFLRFAHTGEYFGVIGQTIAGVVTLLSLILVWTGLSLALRRMLRAVRRGNGSDANEPVEESASDEAERAATAV